MRIGIVNDVPTVAEALRRAVLLHTHYQVSWVARDGTEAVAQCARDLPDILLMDLIMPGMTGVEATHRIMTETPCAILIVTADVGANATCVFEAMAYGAVDAVDTPAWDTTDPHSSMAPLLEKLERIAEQLDARTGVLRAVAPPPPTTSTQDDLLIAIGASAGGPGALAKLLADLPPDFPASIVIVQHVDARFSAGLADWLGWQSCHPVRLAQEGDRPTNGTVLLARGNDHLCLTNTGELHYTGEPSGHIYQPSVDVFFASVCRFWTHGAVGVLLTGMGRDGAVGLKALHDKGYYTIAQDEASSIVYGMPKAAARLNAANEILPLEQIAPRLAAIVSPSGRWRALP